MREVYVMSTLTKTTVVLAGILALGWIVLPAINQANADQEASLTAYAFEDSLPGGNNLPGSIITVQDNSFISNNSHFSSDNKTIYVIVTAYSSTESQTDDTPFITASGTTVRDGIIAANFLPFGTRITIPELYGDKVFEVEDRMAPSKGYHIDIWFPSYQEARDFGAHIIQIEILN